MKSWFASFTTFGLLSTILLAGATIAASSASPVAVLPLMAATGDEYSVAPRPNELKELTAKLRNGLAFAPLHLSLLPPSRTAAVACEDADCARRIGRALGARTVVFGTVQQFSGIQWNMQVSAVEISSGHIVDTLTYGTLGKDFLLGDYYTLLSGVRKVGICLGRAIAREYHCKTA
jgi:Protein of unknown function (DUF2380)